MYSVEEAIQHSKWINQHGVLLDQYGNELRDEHGEITIIPQEERHHFIKQK